VPDLRKKVFWLALAVVILAIFFSWQFMVPAADQRLEPAITLTQPAEAPASQEVLSPEPALRIAAVGDVMLARKLTKLMAANGVQYPFAATADTLRAADITFANLESPISDQGEKLPGKGIWFRAEPKNAAALEMAGFDVLSLANNHALDYLDAAFLQTLDILDEMGIDPVGGGQNIGQARSPVIMEVNGVRTAFLAYSEMADLIWSTQQPRRLQATVDTPGIAPLVLDEVLADIAALRGQADLILVSLHWGVEYQHLPTSWQQDMAHQIIDAGADVILGHHPHCIQGVETYKQGLIAYSLGNFVFDQNQNDDTRSGLMLELTCDRAGWQAAEILPVYISDGQPALTGGAHAQRILAQLRLISADLGSQLPAGEGSIVISNQFAAVQKTGQERGEHY